MRDVMLKYTQAMSRRYRNAAVTASTTWLTCARWLLEVRDRIESD